MFGQNAHNINLKTLTEDELKGLLNKHKNKAEELKSLLDVEQDTIWKIDREVLSRNPRHKEKAAKQMIAVIDSLKDAMAKETYSKLKDSFQSIINDSKKNFYFGYDKILDKYTLDLTWTVRNKINCLFKKGGYRPGAIKSIYHVHYIYDRKTNSWNRKIDGTLFSKNGSNEFAISDSDTKKLANILRKHVPKSFKTHEDMARGMVELVEFINNDFEDYILAYRMII
jgi:hypothetical protein